MRERGVLFRSGRAKLFKGAIMGFEGGRIPDTRIAAAGQTIAASKELSAQEKSEMWYITALHHCKDGKEQKALNVLLNHSLKYNPKNAHAVYLCAYIYLQQGKEVAARNIFEKYHIADEPFLRPNPAEVGEAYSYMNALASYIGGDSNEALRLCGQSVSYGFTKEAIYFYEFICKEQLKEGKIDKATYSAKIGEFYDFVAGKCLIPRSPENDYKNSIIYCAKAIKMGYKPEKEFVEKLLQNIPPQTNPEHIRILKEFLGK